MLKRMEMKTAPRRAKLACIVGVTLLTFVVGGVITTIILGVLIVKPAIYGLQFHGNTTCTTNNSSMGDYVTCSCGKNCNSRFKCVSVRVNYEAKGTSYNNVMFYETEFGRSSLSPQCSATVCHSSESSNDDTIDRFYSDYGTPGSSYQCVYNVNNPGEVILSESFDQEDINLYLGIPISLTLFVLILFICSCQYWYRHSNPRSQPNDAPVSTVSPPMQWSK